MNNPCTIPTNFDIPAAEQEASRRQSISKGKRFDIFKRDCFTCLYCGRKPPEVILHVDHIIAVSKGGTNDDANLVTSCCDCNLGKGAKAMDQTPRYRPTDEDRAEKLEQLRAMAQELTEKAELFEEEFDMVGIHFVQVLWKMNPDEYWLLDREAKTLRQFLRKLPASEVMDAINITANSNCRSENDKFYYFCAVCWKKIKEPDEAKRLSEVQKPISKSGVEQTNKLSTA